LLRSESKMIKSILKRHSVKMRNTCRRMFYGIAVIIIGNVAYTKLH